MTGAERFGGRETSPGDDHRVAALSQSSREPRTEPAIATKDENAAQSTRSAYSGDGTQQTSRRPNSR